MCERGEPLGIGEQLNVPYHPIWRIGGKLIALDGVTSPLMMHIHKIVIQTYINISIKRKESNHNKLLIKLDLSHHYINSIRTNSRFNKDKTNNSPRKGTRNIIQEPLHHLTSNTEKYPITQKKSWFVNYQRVMK